MEINIFLERKQVFMHVTNAKTYVHKFITNSINNGDIYFQGEKQVFIHLTNAKKHMFKIPN